MSLTDQEVEALAEQRLLGDMMNEIIDACREESPQMAEQMDRVMSEYKAAVRQSCPKEGRIEDLIQCIEETKPTFEDELRRQLR